MTEPLKASPVFKVPEPRRCDWQITGRVLGNKVELVCGACGEFAELPIGGGDTIAGSCGHKTRYDVLSGLSGRSGSE